MTEIWEPLFDSHGRRHDYLRVSLTDRCNFRCQYCMPADGVVWQEKHEILSLEEIERLVGIFVRLGVRKVRFTGGEPTVRRGLVELTGRLSGLKGLEQLLLTTNGSSLQNQAALFKSAGLSGINISLDSLRKERFFEITRRDVFDQVWSGIEAAIEAGLPTKINVVVMPGLNEDELVDFVTFTKERPVQVRFIEFMPFSGNLWKPDRVFGYREMLDAIRRRFTLQPLPGETSDVAKEFSIDGHAGTVGFITSMTDSFCSGCNRIRLTAEGKLKTCLFLPNRSSLRDMMRGGSTNDEIAIAIRADLMTKWKEHPPMNEWKHLDNLSMVQIGG